MSAHFRVHPIQFIGRDNTALGLAPMTFFRVLMNAPSFCGCELKVSQGKVEVIDFFLMQTSLVALKSKEVVTIFGCNLIGKSSLDSHRVNRDGVAFKVELIDDATHR